MNIFLPNIYCRTIMNIDYATLKDRNIDNLMFDLDNTIVPEGIYNDIETRKNVIDLFKEINKLFNVVIVTSARFTSFARPVVANRGVNYFDNIKNTLGVKDVFSNVNKLKLVQFDDIIKKMDFDPINTVMIGNYFEDIVLPNLLGIRTIMVVGEPSITETRKIKYKKLQ